MADNSVSARQARVLRIWQSLYGGAAVNADELAAQLNVCRRTIFRDLNIMRAAGTEIVFDSQLNCYRLARPPRDAEGAPLEDDELAQLLFAAHLSPLQTLPDVAAGLRRATTKLLAFRSESLRHSIMRLIRSCQMAVLVHELPERVSPLVPRILDAIRQRLTLSLVFYELTWRRSVETRFAPFRVVVASDAWRITGQSSHHAKVVTIDVASIERLEVTDEVFVLPQPFSR